MCALQGDERAVAGTPGAGVEVGGASGPRPPAAGPHPRPDTSGTTTGRVTMRTSDLTGTLLPVILIVKALKLPLCIYGTIYLSKENMILNK